LGVVCSYFNRATCTKFSPSLQSLPYTGGLIVQDFILGFNFVTNTYITDAVDLSQQNSIQINTPLLKSTIYKTFVNNGKNPLVFKSLSYFNGILSQYTTFHFGKYSNQVSYSKMTYGFTPIGNEPVSGYVSSFKQFYPTVIIEYYWYDGAKWRLSTETVGGNDSDNYNIYTDTLGNKYLQHQFEFPFILIPYTKPFIYQLGSSTYSSSPMGSVPFGSIPMGSMPMGSMPMGSVPMGSSPMGSIPMGSSPMGSSPMGSSPMGSSPMGSSPCGSVPCGSIN